MRQIGSGQASWWRASRSPTPRPALKAATARPDRPLIVANRPSRLRLRATLPVIAIGLAGAAGFVALIGSGSSTRPTAPALAEIEHMLDLAGYGLTQVSLTGHRLTTDSDIFDALDLAQVAEGDARAVAIDAVDERPDGRFEARVVALCPHAANACRAALAMLADIERFNAARAEAATDSRRAASSAGSSCASVRCSSGTRGATASAARATSATAVGRLGRRVKRAMARQFIARR